MIIVYEKWVLTIFLVISMISQNGKSQMSMNSMFAMVPPTGPIYEVPMFGMQPPQSSVVHTVQVPSETDTDDDEKKKSHENKNKNNNGNGNVGISAYAGSIPMQMPMPMPMPVPISVPIQMSAPMPLPTPIQLTSPLRISIPAQEPPSFCKNKPRHRNCPPCPPCICSPSCTPSFYSYCSSCHKRCRCRSQEDTPLPRSPLSGQTFSVTFPNSPPHLLVHLEDYNNHGKEHKNRVQETEESGDYDASESCERTTKKARRQHLHPRSFRRNNDYDGDFVRPEISYLAENGEVKIRRRLSNADAENLLSEVKNIDKPVTEDPFSFITSLPSIKMMNQADKTPNSKVNVFTDSSQLQVLHEPVLNKVNKGPLRTDAIPDSILFESIKKKLFKNKLITPEILKLGKKHLVFKPPQDKKISNISISFMVT